MSMSLEAAQVIALRALAWLAGHEDLLPVFMGSTGVDAETLKAGAEDPEVQRAVLDFLMMDDAWVVAFCDSEGLDYTSLNEARHCLPGGEEVHWT